MTDLVSLRRELHAKAETAFEEHATAKHLEAWLAQHGLEPVARPGKTGLLYDFGEGKTVLLRSELDALPLDEDTGAHHAAEENHHACGHDGHMAMLAGALAKLAKDPPCRVLAFFQPAEESGEGMAACLDELPEADLCFAFHNIPGAPLGQVLVRQGPAAAASVGLRLRFEGSTSHAAEPWAGHNPVPAMAETVRLAQAAPMERLRFGDQAMVAFVEASAGGPRYGTSTGDAMLGMTLRAGTDGQLDALVDAVVAGAKARAGTDIDVSQERIEPFPATTNHDDAVAIVRRAADAAGLDSTTPDRPFAWSEDFGHLTAKVPGALIGIGSGEDQPNLHSPRYDFPDDLIDHGVRLWCAIVEAAA